MGMFKEFFGMIFWLFSGKRNSDLSDNDADFSVAEYGALGHGCVYVAEDEDKEFWQQDDKVAIWRPSVSTCVLVEATTKLIEGIDESCESLDDARSALDFWLEQDEQE